MILRKFHLMNWYVIENLIASFLSMFLNMALNPSTIISSQILWRFTKVCGNKLLLSLYFLTIWLSFEMPHAMYWSCKSGSVSVSISTCRLLPICFQVIRVVQSAADLHPGGRSQQHEILTCFFSKDDNCVVLK